MRKKEKEVGWKLGVPKRYTGKLDISFRIVIKGRVQTVLGFIVKRTKSSIIIRDIGDTYDVELDRNSITKHRILPPQTQKMISSLNKSRCKH